jgi:heme-degrading monooxygenase HmoA
MITRIWRGWTRPEQADAYQQLLLTEIFPEIAARGIRGYRGIQLLRRETAGEVEFVTIMWFDSLDDIRTFSGADYETAVVPAKARALLTRFDNRSAHYDTVVSPFPQPLSP